MRKIIKVGVLGVGRGQTFMQGAGALTGMKLVAICDTWKEKLNEAGKKYKVATYTDYDKFLEHDMDAVVLANYFNEHAPFAIKALNAGFHVMSETATNSTLAEGVALFRAVEKSKKIYMLAENYPYTVFNMEMKRVYKTGELGEVMYAEGEYNHPMDPETSAWLAPGLNHWRIWCPSTYYCTHALAPLMYITETMPLSVNALSIAKPSPERRELAIRKGDPGSVILCRMDNGSVFRIFGMSVAGHSNWYRVHGTLGAMETTRGPGYFGPEQVRVWHDEWDLKKGQVKDRVYSPEWPSHGDLAKKSGHGGGDFWTNFEFANAIRSGKQPYLDVYRGVAMSSVGIIGWKSCLENGLSFELPDFKKEESRKKYEDDNWSPWPKDARLTQPPPSLLGFPKPTKKGLEFSRKIWRGMGYREK